METIHKKFEAFSYQEQEHMREAIKEAHLAEKEGEVPVGCVITFKGTIIGRGHNQVISHHDPTAHAEMMALRHAAQSIGNYRLTETTLFVTLEPCMMCMGAIYHARSQKIIFATGDAKTGACGGMCVDILHSPYTAHLISIEQGLYETECSDMLTNFFKNKRKTPS